MPPARAKSEPADRRPPQDGVGVGVAGPNGRRSAAGAGGAERRSGNAVHVAGRPTPPANRQSKNQNGRLHRRQVLAIFSPIISPFQSNFTGFYRILPDFRRGTFAIFQDLIGI